MPSRYRETLPPSTKDSSGTGQALAFNANFQPITAVGSDPLILYATGLGPTNPSAPTNSLGATGPLDMAVDTVSVSIGGSPAAVPYAGIAPDLDGIYQINVIPPKFFTGNSLSVMAGGYPAKVVTLPVASGANIKNLTGSIDGLYPASGAVAARNGGRSTDGPVTFSALLLACTFTTTFNILPNADPFQVVAQVSTDVLTDDAGTQKAVINIDPNLDPAQGTWQETWSVPTSAAGIYDFSGAPFVVQDFTTGSPFPWNIIPVSRVDPMAMNAIRMLAAPDSPGIPGKRANTTNTASGALPAASSFTMTGNFGGFINLPHNPGTHTATLQLYVDNVLVVLKAIPFTE